MSIIPFLPMTASCETTAVVSVSTHLPAITAKKSTHYYYYYYTHLMASFPVKCE